MPVYQIPVVYGMVEFIDVEADSLFEATEEVWNSLSDLTITDPTYIEGSLEVDEEWAHTINVDNLSIDDVDAREYK
jgi:hypothetical protein